MGCRGAVSWTWEETDPTDAGHMSHSFTGAVILSLPGSAVTSQKLTTASAEAKPSGKTHAKTLQRRLQTTAPHPWRGGGLANGGAGCDIRPPSSWPWLAYLGRCQPSQCSRHHHTSLGVTLQGWAVSTGGSRLTHQPSCGSQLCLHIITEKVLL